MKRLFLIPLTALAFIPAALHAEDALIIDKNSHNSIISGTITRMQGDTAFISTAGHEIQVDLDDIDIDNIDKVFAPGMEIAVKGNFTDDGYTPVLKADKILQVQNGTVLNSQALLLQDDDDD